MGLNFIAVACFGLYAAYSGHDFSGYLAGMFVINEIQRLDARR